MSCDQIIPSENANDSEGGKLGDCKYRAHAGSGGYPTKIDGGKNADEQGENVEAYERARGIGPEFGEVNHEQIRIGGAGGEAHKPDQPRDLNTHKTSERLLRIKVGTAGIGEARGNFGKARHHHSYSKACDDDAENAGSTRFLCEQGGQTENTAADDAVDGERGEAPAADGADQAFVGCRRLGGFAHRAFVSQARVNGDWDESQKAKPASLGLFALVTFCGRK
jgi:hypothetical protein